MTILELSVFAIEYLSTVLLWNQGTKCVCEALWTLCLCVWKHTGMGPFHFQNSAIYRCRITHWVSQWYSYLWWKRISLYLTSESPELAALSDYHQLSGTNSTRDTPDWCTSFVSLFLRTVASFAGWQSALWVTSSRVGKKVYLDYQLWTVGGESMEHFKKHSEVMNGFSRKSVVIN